jgi:serine/threonine-protein kinase
MNEPREGDVLAGKYRIERVLGVGGMGMVVSAVHLQLDERVAIKFLLPDALANPEAVARFGREARAAVKIKSEHVARVTDVSTLENGSPYMVMEFLRGHDLSAALRDGGAMPVHLAVQYVLQACEALAEAHAVGIVHRDLKPANLFLTSRADGSPCVKVLDFGISKVTNVSGSGSDMGMTRTQSIMGSPLYMSPEQMASSRDVDQRADVWAIGCVLYELITGRVPFEAETMPQLCTLILHQEPPPPRSIRPEIPDGVASAIMRCLRKDRAQRYPNVAALAMDLAAFSPDAGPRSAERISRVLSSSGISSPALVSSNFPAHVAASNTGSQAWGTTQVARSNRAVWLGAVIAALLAAGGVVAWKASSHAAGASPGVSAAAAPNAKPPALEPTVPPTAAPTPVVTAAPVAAPPSASVTPSREPATTAKSRPSVKPPVGTGKGKPKPTAEPGVDPLSERN